MSIHNSGHEHEIEPQHGLPERLPPDERILWQGSPHWRGLARHAFHVRALAAYFAVLLGWSVASSLADGLGAGPALWSARWLAVAGLLCVGTFLWLAWLTARATVYTITDKRVVMRIGIVLTVTFNLPLRSIAAAGLRPLEQGRGDIPLALAGPDRISYLHLWPHARPWRLAYPEPMLRSVPDAVRVAALLSQAWSARTGSAVAPAAASVQSPSVAASPAWRTSPT
jgi:hypothetical protein